MIHRIFLLPGAAVMPNSSKDRCAAAWAGALLPLLLPLLLLAPPLRAQPAAAPQREPLDAFPQTLLSIRVAGPRVLNFKVWVADRPNRQEQGLMFVRELDEHAGMLFKFPVSQQLSMWMKNTFIPLDMLFIDGRGRIDYIAASTTPLSLDIIQAPRPVDAVLELKGGACERLGIRPGDQVLNAELGKSH